MKILFSKDIFHLLKKELKKTKKDVLIISAFCKRCTLDALEEEISYTVKKKKLLVRFRLSDLINGVTDISIYDFCKRHGWEMYVSFDLHAKTYIFDRKRCIIGSANITNKGLGINSNPNIEISSISNIEKDDLKKIEYLFATSLKVDDDLFEKMHYEFSRVKKSKNCNAKTWSKKILALVESQNAALLLSHEIPKYPFSNTLRKNDLDFLEMKPTSSRGKIQRAFLSSKVFLWLYHELELAENKQLFFGELTQLLHNKLLTDPPPYRKDVKFHLVNILSWIEALGMDVITITRPSHSLLISIKRKK